MQKIICMKIISFCKIKVQSNLIRTAGRMTLNTLKTRALPKSNWPLGTAAPCMLIIDIIITNFWSMISHSISWPGVFLSTHGILVKYFKHRYHDIGVPDQIPCRQSKYLHLSGYQPQLDTSSSFKQRSTKKSLTAIKTFGPLLAANSMRWGSHKMPAINSPLS